MDVRVLATFFLSVAIVSSFPAEEILSANGPLQRLGGLVQNNPAHHMLVEKLNSLNGIGIEEVNMLVSQLLKPEASRDERFGLVKSALQHLAPKEGGDHDLAELSAILDGISPPPK